MTDPTSDLNNPARRVSVESTLLTLAVLGAVVALLSIITFVPHGTNAAATSSGGGPTAQGQQTNDQGDPNSSSADNTDTGTAATVTGGNQQGSAAGSPSSTQVAGPAAGIDCSKGKNLGNTAPGVTTHEIKLGASTVSSGAGSSFLGPVVAAMKAVQTKVNSQGGICGRLLNLSLHDSGWRAESGYSIIQNLVQGEKVFALAVNPDSEGLDFASTKNYLAEQQIPVVGTDGLLISQYQDPYIWPVAAPTVSAMYAIAKSQCDAGLKKFSIVFETTYRFGREGSKAYDLAAKACTGHDIAGYYDPDKGQSQCSESFCGILSGATSYNSEASKFCANSDSCDAGAVLLEPATARVWFANGGRAPDYYQASNHPGALGTPQPLFSASFAQQCDKTCDGLRVWTGFRPPIEQFANESKVQQYANEVKAYDPSIDIDNQFVEGGYLGMTLMVKALTDASQLAGGLTRQNVVSVLDHLSSYDSGLTVNPLAWQHGNHFAETTVHAFDEQFGDTGFGGWKYTGLKVTDPNPFAATSK